MSKKKVTSLVWFRNNLRVLDNISLSKSIEESDKTIGYINIDPKDFKESRFGFKKIEKFRAKFFLESIGKQSLRKKLIERVFYSIKVCFAIERSIKNNKTVKINYLK